MGLPCQGQIKSRKAVHHCGFSLFLQSLTDEEWNSFCAKSNVEQDVPHNLKPLGWFAICSLEEEKGPCLFLEGFNAIWSLGVGTLLPKWQDQVQIHIVSTAGSWLMLCHQKWQVLRWTDLRCNARQQLIQYSWGGLSDFSDLSWIKCSKLKRTL